MEINSLGPDWRIHEAATGRTDPQNHAEARHLIRAVHRLNKAERFGPERELVFQIDQETRRVLMRVVDRETGEVVQQLPPEYVLRVSQELFGDS
jgi:flagellar protein FlaG